jgi:hypothetical protein
VPRQKFAAHSCIASDLHVIFNAPIASITKNSALQPGYWEKVLFKMKDTMHPDKGVRYMSSIEWSV